MRPGQHLLSQAIRAKQRRRHRPCDKACHYLVQTIRIMSTCPDPCAASKTTGTCPQRWLMTLQDSGQHSTEQSCTSAKPLPTCQPWADLKVSGRAVAWKAPSCHWQYWNTSSSPHLPVRSFRCCGVRAGRPGGSWPRGCSQQGRLLTARLGRKRVAPGSNHAGLLLDAKPCFCSATAGDQLASVAQATLPLWQLASGPSPHSHQWRCLSRMAITLPAARVPRRACMQSRHGCHHASNTRQLATVTLPVLLLLSGH